MGRAQASEGCCTLTAIFTLANIVTSSRRDRERWFTSTGHRMRAALIKTESMETVACLTYSQVICMLETILTESASATEECCSHKNRRSTTETGQTTEDKAKALFWIAKEKFTVVTSAKTTWKESKRTRKISALKRQLPFLRVWSKRARCLLQSRKTSFPWQVS